MKHFLLALFICGFFVQASAGEQKADTSQIPLPVTGVSHPIRFLTFSAVRMQQDIKIQFSTPSESITSNYFLERSENGTQWEIITSIPTQNNANSINKYQYTDRNIAARMIYYRVKQVYANGVFTYSPIVYARDKSQHEKLRVSGSHNGTIAVYFPEESKNNVQLQLRTLNGQLLMSQTLARPAGNILLQTGTANRGILTVALTDGELLHHAQTIILQ